VNHRYCVLVVALWAVIPLAADTIDFEGFPDSTSLTTQYPGLIFSDALIISAGASLDETDFPPESGINVVLDNGGPITIDFLTPITDFSAFFTYTEQLTLTGFDSADNPVASATSLFFSNFVSSGNPPDEVISLSDVPGMSSVTIAGDPAGNSFTMDDMSFTPQLTSVPEPALITPCFAMFLLLCIVLSVQKGSNRMRMRASRAQKGYI
jgi:hypothetical protein